MIPKVMGKKDCVRQGLRTATDLVSVMDHAIQPYSTTGPYGWNPSDPSLRCRNVEKMDML